MKTKDRSFSGKRLAAYKKMYQLGIESAWEALMYGVNILDADINCDLAREWAVKCAVDGFIVDTKNMHGVNRKKYFIAGATYSM